MILNKLQTVKDLHYINLKLDYDKPYTVKESDLRCNN